MTKVFFIRDYHHELSRYVSTTYRAGCEYELEDDVVEKAIILGAATPVVLAEHDLVHGADRQAKARLADEIEDLYLHGLEPDDEDDSE